MVAFSMMGLAQHRAYKESYCHYEDDDLPRVHSGSVARQTGDKSRFHSVTQSASVPRPRHEPLTALKPAGFGRIPPAVLPRPPIS